MTKNNAAENKKLIAAFIFILFSVVFWAIFEQAGGSLSLFAKDNVGNNLVGMTVDQNGINNSINALFVILFAPLVALNCFSIYWLRFMKKLLVYPASHPTEVSSFG
jgi:POT family proton-dependent oligopeptide transporter